MNNQENNPEKNYESPNAETEQNDFGGASANMTSVTAETITDSSNWSPLSASDVKDPAHVSVEGSNKTLTQPPLDTQMETPSAMTSGVNKTRDQLVCTNCGALLNPSQAFCTKCGTKAPEPPLSCRSCGANLEEGQAFCSKCGTKVDLSTPSALKSSIENYNLTMIASNKKKKQLPIILGIVAGVVVAAILLLVFLGGKKTFNFAKEFPEYEGKTWCEFADDGSWMKLDSNPSDKDSDDLSFLDLTTTIDPCNEAVKKINQKLGFSDSLMKKIEETSALQGVRTETNDKFEVSWTYHPSKGLEIMYEVKNK